MKKFAIIIEAHRTGYEIDQCGKTMTAGELMEYLEDCDPDTPVFISNDSGYTFGEIKRHEIYERDFPDDDEEYDEDEET